MRRIVLTFGLISGFILLAMLAVTLPLTMSGRMDFDGAEVLGYTSMLLAFLMVFFGIRSYRRNIGGGAITFGRAFKVGILITLVTCAVYVIAWEIYYFNFDHGFAEQYAAHVLDKMQREGATEAAISAERVKMEKFRELYQNPLINSGMTFLEVFPLGLIMTLVSAGVLRKKKSQLDLPKDFGA